MASGLFHHFLSSGSFPPRINIASAKLKKKYPDIASECSKTTAKAGYVKITLKEGGQ